MFRAVRFTIPSVTPRPRSRNVETGRVDLCRARVLAESFDSSVGRSHTGPTHFASATRLHGSSTKRIASRPRARRQDPAREQKATRASRSPGRPRGGSLSVGKRLSAPLRISVRPVGRRVRGPSPACAIVASESWVPSLLPRPFAWSGKRRVDEAIRCRQLRPITMRRTSETGAISSAEDADSPWTFSDLEEPSPSRVDL